MGAISLTTRLSVSNQLVTQSLDDELVMLDFGSETYFGLDEISTRAWQLIEMRGTLLGVLEELGDDYEVEQERLSADLIAFAEHLREKGLLHVDQTDTEAQQR